MLIVGKTSAHLLAASAALLGFFLAVPLTIRAESPAPRPGRTEPVEAEFRGCDAAGSCRFSVEPSSPGAKSLLRVRPDGVPPVSGDYGISIALRDRLNLLLSNMIHQSKHIVLLDLHELDDGTFAATVIVNDANLATDPVLLELNEKLTNTIR